MAFNPMQQQQSPDMLMAMMTDPRATPQQRMAAMSALNAMRGGANAPQQIGDMDPAFMAAVRQEMMGQGPEEQPEIPQRQAAPEAPQNPSTEALMSGAADASRVAAMAHGGAVRHYLNGTDGNDPSSYSPKNAAMGMINFAKRTNLENLSLPELVDIIEDPTTEPSVRARAISKATISGQGGQAAPPPEAQGDGITDWVNKHQKEAKAYVDEQRKIIDDPNRSFASKALAGAEAGGTQIFDVYGAGAFGKLFGNPSKVNISGDEVGAVAAPGPAAPGPAAPGPAAPKRVVPKKVVPGVAPVANAGDGVLKVDPDIANKLINAPPNLAQDVPKKKDYFKLLEEKLTEDKSKLSSQDKYMALLQASLGTMAAASQPGGTFLGSIGQGGMLGIKQIEDARVLRAKERAGDLDTYAKLAEIQQKSKEKALSKGQEAIDTNYGKEYADFLGRGGASVAAGQLKNLADARNIITDAIANKKSITGPVASFVTSDNMPKWVGSFAAPETVTVQDMINSVAQSNLRNTLGAQFAQKEGEGVLQRVFNPALSPQENLRRLDMLTSSIDSASKAKEAEAKWFEENDTLRGYKGPSVNDYLYELRDNLDKSDKNSLPKGKKPVSENRSAADKIILGE
jgi:hypothetical protein